ncbi:DEAD/DEAH box helicase [Nocardiopsis alba]|uniref:DEAD/DEAH box helicase n=1 Tax=Nocardiopsis alba TaxID=53437 RepID=UPI00366C2EBD
MRSLQDDEQIGHAGSYTPVGGTIGDEPEAGSGVGAASLRWKRSVDVSRTHSFLAYTRSCLHREAVHRHEATVGRLDSDVHACMPAGPELLLSGAREALPLHEEGARVARLAGRHGQALRYGYPLVVLGEGTGDDRIALPLFVVDVRPVEEPGERDRPGTPSLRAVGTPDVNVALLARIGVTDPEDLFELRTRLRSGAPDPIHRPAAVAELAAKTRILLSRLEIERVDDIDPLGTRGRPLRPVRGAHNTAVLYRAGPGGRPEGEPFEPGLPEGLLADLDPTDPEGLDPDAVPGTALEPLLGSRPEARAPRERPQRERRRSRSRAREEAVSEPAAPEIVPIAASPLGQAQYEVLRAAMGEQLTVAAAPPGGGVHDLVDTVVRTAVAEGQRVLICCHGESDIDEVLARADTSPEHPVVRAGGVAEARRLTRILVRDTGLPPAWITDPGEPVEREDDLVGSWNRIREVWEAMDDVASGGHVLADLASERGRDIVRGWNPESLFTPERGGPEYWLHRAERAIAGGLGGLSHRSAVRRELGVTTDPESLARLCSVARMESEWREAVERRTRRAPLNELTAILDEAMEEHRRAGALRLSSVTGPRLRRGRAAVVNRLESLNWNDGGGRPAMGDLLDILPAWICRTDQARALPSGPGSFDLVIVVGAERTRVGELLPVLYRSVRALVIGDPAHPGPATALEPEEERRALATAGLDAEELDERGLRHGTGSALRAAARGASATLWLDEHDGAPEPLASVASEYCYGGRIAVRTEPHPGDEPVVDWRDVAGDCEAAPGSSYVNRDEAYRVAVVVDELDRTLPEEWTLTVVAPLQPQVALLRRLLRQCVLRRRVRVGGPELPVDGTTDVTVLSPMLTADAPAIAERRVMGMGHLWSSVLTRTRRRLVVVGDRAHWAAGRGPLTALLARDGEGGLGLAEEPRDDPATVALVEALRAAGTEVVVRPRVRGWATDLVVRYGARRVVVLLDREPDGPALRRLLARGEALDRGVEDLVVIVPAWRCLADPRTLVEEILSAC